MNPRDQDEMARDNQMQKPVFRFAPSPNGFLHLGHAASALANQRLAQVHAGRLLLRIEDIDLLRAEPEFEQAILYDLDWLGIAFEPQIRRQSEHLDDYRAALAILQDEGLAYPAFMSRGEIRRHVADFEATGKTWPRDPDGTPHYPPDDRQIGARERRRRIAEGAPHAWRLDMEAALRHAGAIPQWEENGAGPAGETGRCSEDPRSWGDVMIARRNAPATYHLAVVIDDAIQNVSHVVRGRDLFHATAVHRLLQELLGLPVPHYHHHGLILGSDGRKLSKSRADVSLRQLRRAGCTPRDIRRMAGEARCP